MDNEECAIYCRSRVKNSYSLMVQEETCRKYAKDKGLYVVRVFVDNGHCGGSLERGGLQKMSYICKTLGLKHIIASSRDRLSSDITVYAKIKKFALENNINLHYADNASIKDYFDHGLITTISEDIYNYLKKSNNRIRYSYGKK